MTPLVALHAGHPEAGRALVRRLDPRLRVLAAVAFALATVALQSLGTVLIALAVAAGLATAAAMPLRPTLRRVLALDLVVLPLLVILPFTIAGPPAFEIGGFPASWAGIWRASEVLLTTNAVVLALVSLVGTIEPALLGHALAGLRLPEKLVQLFLLTTRYIAVLNEEYARLRQAMRARAFRPRGDRHTWIAYGWLFGMLLVRSFERAERILEAMRCRGFHGRLHRLAMPLPDRSSIGWSLGLFLLMALLVLADRLA